jgi:endonuclease-8
MSEGDTVFLAAQTLHRFMAGHLVTRFESVYPAVTRIADDQPVVGRTIESVSARGKHLLISFSGGLVLRTHLRMNGSWHIYPSGGRWQRPARDMRVLVGTAEACAVGFNIPVAELLSGRDVSRQPLLKAL